MALKWVWRYVSPYKGRMFFGLSLVLLVALLNMVIPYLSGVIIDDVIMKNNFGLLVPIIVIMLSVTLLKSLSKYFFQMIFEKVSQKVIFNVREKMYSDLQKQDFSFFDSTKTGDIMARMTGDMDMIRHFVAWVVYMVFENAAIFGLAMLVMFTINARFTLILLAITPALGFLAYKLATEVRPTFDDIRNKFSKLNSVVQENISGNRVVKAFAKEKYETEKFLKENAEYKDSNLKSAKIWEKYLPVIETIAGVLPMLMILIGGIMVVRKTLTLGELVIFNSLIFALNNPMRVSGWLINDVQKFYASADKIRNLMDTTPKVTSTAGNLEPERIKGNIEFRNVSFCYNKECVLKNINFSARPGQTIGIIGPTGSGKTTLINLICRFYDATEGEVIIDGNNIKLLNLGTLRESIGIAMQDIFLFSDTIEGNICYGLPHASLDQVKHAASIADADGFITTLPDGYDTIVGERGVGLSGGQRQRISLARALLRNPSILVLDDATSSLDLETEKKIQGNLKSYFKEKTTFVIAHRISSVKDADLILVLNNGEIVEQGKHEELIKGNGYYHSVYVNQCGNFNGCDDEKKEI
jgi:ATP-binding cassette, subfamily B, multidrug efflux pump